MKRRSFLGLMGMAGAGMAMPATAGAAVKDFRGYPGSMGVLFDATRCIGCRRCEAACNKANELPAPEVPFDNLDVLNTRRRTDAATYTVVNRFDLPGGAGVPQEPVQPLSGAACASACFVRAFEKQHHYADVKYDDTVCVGCRYCMIACPFEIPTYEYHKALTPRVMKCTLCGPLIRAGKLDVPACVGACPKEAMTYGRRDELINLARRRFAVFPGKYIEHIYGEHEMGGTSWMHISGVPFQQIGFREDLGTKSAPELTAGSLASVPVVVGVWPVLLGGIYAINRRMQKIADQEKKTAVTQALAKARAEAQTELEAALAKAQEAAQRQTDNEVKKAVKEALAKLEEPQAEAQGKTEEEGA